MEVIFLELVDEDGEVRNRIHVARLPFGIGRDLENDLILDDPFVCPRHLELRREEDGSIHVHDLKSVNGLVDDRDGVKGPTLVVRPDRVMRIGHTRFRIRRSSDPVAPTLRDESSGLWALDPFKGSLVRLFHVLAGVSVIAANRFLGVWTRVSVEKSILPELMEYFLGLLAYSAFWSLLGLIVVRRWRYSHHMAVFSCALFLGGLVDVLTNWVIFNLPATTGVLQSLNPPVFLICVAVFWHLGYASRLSRSRRALVALSIYVLAAGLTYAKARKSQHEFKPQPVIDEPLMPPVFLVAPRLSVDDLGPRMEKLRAEVDRQAMEKKAEQGREKK